MNVIIQNDLFIRYSIEMKTNNTLKNATAKSLKTLFPINFTIIDECTLKVVYESSFLLYHAIL